MGIYGLWKYTGCFQIKKIKVFRKKTRELKKGLKSGESRNFWLFYKGDFFMFPFCVRHDAELFGKHDQRKSHEKTARKTVLGHVSRNRPHPTILFPFQTGDRVRVNVIHGVKYYSYCGWRKSPFFVTVSLFGQKTMSQDKKREDFIGLNSTIRIAAQDIHGLDTTGHPEIT